MTLRVLDLFSGIGGFSLGLERAGMRTVAFCEIEPYCRAVLRKHWPAVPIFEDVRDLHAYDVGPVDVICGGFPCQDISSAGKGAGLRGERSGLWSEYRRLIEECRPSWVIVENVSALRSRGLDEVLGEISALGYDAEWHCISASAVGAPHRRDRVWIVAYPSRVQQGRQEQRPERERAGASSEPVALLADADVNPRLSRWLGDALKGARRWDAGGGGIGADPLADANCNDEHGRRGDVQVGRLRSQGEAPEDVCAWRTQWSTEPDVGRVAHGIPARVERLRSLGNAVVPQIPELIGRAILEAETVCVR